MVISLINRIATTALLPNPSEQPVYDIETGEYIGSYYFYNNKSSFHEFDRFMIIYRSDGTPWYDGCNFLIDFIKTNPSISIDTIERYERALREFIYFCQPLDKNGNLAEHINYKQAEYENFAPTYQFRNHLIETKVLTKTSETAVERLLPPVCKFYEWMIKNGHKFQAKLWTEKVYIRNGKERISRDVCHYINHKNDGVYIYDSGSLRPLVLYEERLIRRAVNAIGSPEYRLIFFIALNSFARKQTVMTLRLHNIMDALPNNVEEIPNSFEEAGRWIQSISWPSDMQDCSILVGKGHGSDVKGDNKSYRIKIKGWLLKQIVVYIVSARAFQRRKLAFVQRSELDQYIFLTDQGNPMYHGKNDRGYNNKKYRRTAKRQNGNSLDQFINNELRPWLKRRGVDIEFHFHCLRATGAIRFLEERARKANRHGYSLADWSVDLESLRQLMGHSSIETTLHYLRYMSFNNIIDKKINDVGEWYFEQMQEWI